MRINLTHPWVLATIHRLSNFPTTLPFVQRLEERQIFAAMDNFATNGSVAESERSKSTVFRWGTIWHMEKRRLITLRDFWRRSISSKTSQLFISSRLTSRQCGGYWLATSPTFWFLSESLHSIFTSARYGIPYPPGTYRLKSLRPIYLGVLPSYGYDKKF